MPFAWWAGVPSWSKRKHMRRAWQPLQSGSTYGVDALLYYQGETLTAERGGHQGCSLMMALFCSVQQKLKLDSGVLATDEVRAAIPLDLAPSFADDGILAGKTAQVLAAHRAQVELAPRLGLEYN